MDQTLTSDAVNGEAVVSPATFAVELFFEPTAEARIRGVWDALEAHGVERTARFAAPDYRPHVSLAVCDLIGSEPPAEVLRHVGTVEFELSALGFFLDPGHTVAFLAIIPSQSLLATHQAVTGALAEHGAQVRKYYQPGAWTPHCTLPFDVADVAIVAEVIRGAGLPVVVRAGDPRVVRFD